MYTPQINKVKRSRGFSTVLIYLHCDFKIIDWAITSVFTPATLTKLQDPN